LFRGALLLRKLSFACVWQKDPETGFWIFLRLFFFFFSRKELMACPQIVNLSANSV
jgi:hypothetical protein